jgi:hypothetical protein
MGTIGKHEGRASKSTSKSSTRSLHAFFMMHLLFREKTGYESSIAELLIDALRRKQARNNQNLVFDIYARMARYKKRPYRFRGVVKTAETTS